MSRITRILPSIACAASLSRAHGALLVVALLGAGSAHAGPELKKSDVKEIIADAMPDIRRCGLDLPKAQTVKVRWTIQPEGDVKKVVVLGKHAKTELGRCLQKQVAQLRFGHSIKSTPVTYPFRLGTIAKDQKAPAASNGTLTKKDLEGLLEIVEGDLKKCGEGTAVARFTIKPSGQVRDVKVTDVDAKAEDCVKRKVSRLRFPPPPKSTTVRRAFSLDEPAAPSGEG